MNKTAAWLAVHALERLGIRFTFGIPGVHTTELYDELNRSVAITPILVSHEGGGAFMADAVSRVADLDPTLSPAAGQPFHGAVGTLAIVPAAGFTHAASGIGEALLGGVPMLILSGGIRTDTGQTFQLHGIDLIALARPLTKAAFRVIRHQDVVPTLFEAARIATGADPGPVLVEIPANLLLFPGPAGTLPEWVPPPPAPPPAPDRIAAAADLLCAAQRPGLFVGWGGRGATGLVTALAEWLDAPVATTLQGLSSFPADHRLHAGFGYGPAAVPAARNAFAGCDVLLAIGTRFAEIPTGSFSAAVPDGLIHIDCNPAVIGANYPARIALTGDAGAVVKDLLDAVRARPRPRPAPERIERIAADKNAYRQAWLAHDSRGRVNPARFFDQLRAAMPAEAITVLDDGNHTFLTAELFPVHRGGRVLTPSDFNAMGYAVPAAIGAKLARPEREVFAIVGDGCFLMTCMEIVTAASRGLGVIYFVFRDGTLSQIAQAQAIPYNRTPCTALAGPNLAGVAVATGAAHLDLPDDAAIAAVIAEARRLAAQGTPVIVEVAIDYSRPTAFTTGTAQATFRRFALSQRLRFAGRALARRITG